MAPPPSQAGKFKPRKPAKKITVGGEAASASAAAGAAAPDVAPSSQAGGSSGRGGGSRGGGGGRGGRDGRGRRGGGGRDGGGRGPRAPMPQGQAFFTAQPAPTTTASGRQRRQANSGEGGLAPLHNPLHAQQQGRGLASSNASGGGMHERNAAAAAAAAAAAPEEEIVGTLEYAVGSMVPTSVKSASDTSKSKDAAQKAFERAFLGDEEAATMGKSHGSDGYMYDSDSSREDDHRLETRTRHSVREAASARATIQMPLSLPFPSAGGGAVVDHGPDAVSSSADPDAASRSKHGGASPPFVHTGNHHDLMLEQDAWFLVQLPTRLPPVQQKADIQCDEDMMVDTVACLAEETAAVATPSLQTEAFDNVLASAVPGRIGKIKVYKSGKTVLVLEGADGVPTMTMNVSEGLSCGFQQQAVAIDLENGADYVPLGPVRKTVVMTPDLKAAMKSTPDEAQS